MWDESRVNFFSSRWEFDLQLQLVWNQILVVLFLIDAASHVQLL